MVSEAVGLTANLPAKRVMRVQVGDHDLAVWRSASGRLSAWNNRCPHRGMRLSHGFVRGEALACLYHGWHYDGDGICRFIPSHPELEPPKTICTVSHSVTERNGVIWVSVEGDVVPTDLVDDLEPVRTISFDCSVECVSEELLQSSYIDEAGGEYSPVTVGDKSNVIVFKSAKGGELYLLLQGIDENITNIHVLVKSGWSAFQKIAASRWLETLRRKTENKQALEISEVNA